MDPSCILAADGSSYETRSQSMAATGLDSTSALHCLYVGGASGWVHLDHDGESQERNPLHASIFVRVLAAFNYRLRCVAVHNCIYHISSADVSHVHHATKYHSETNKAGIPCPRQEKEETQRTRTSSRRHWESEVSPINSFSSSRSSSNR